MEDAISEEARRVRRLQLCVDVAIAAILQGAFTRDQSEHLVFALRDLCGELCPGKEETFALLLAPRLYRAITEAFGPQDLV